MIIKLLSGSCPIARRAALWVLLLCSVPVTVLSAVTTDTEVQRQQTREQARALEEQQQQPHVVLPESVPEGVQSAFRLPKEAPCFSLRVIRLEGERRDAFAFIIPFLNRAVGQCVGQQGLNFLLREAGDLIIAHGFTTTRLGLPPQNLASGVLRIRVKPGLIGDVRVVGVDGKPSTAGDWHNAFPFRVGDLLNLRELEQGLEQIKRLPSVDAEISIEPGRRDGESTVILRLAPARPWRLVATVDNSGLPSTGTLQAGLSLAWDNLTGHFDQLIASVNNDAQPFNSGLSTSGSSVAYSLPWGDWLGSIAVGTSRYRQTIAGVNQTFISSGTSRNAELKLQRLLSRDRTSKTTLQARIIKRWSKSYIDDAEIDVQRRDTTAVELAVLQRLYAGRAQIDVQLAQRQGIPWFGGQADQSTLGPATPTYGYTLQTFDLALSLPLPHAMAYTAQFHGQYSSDVLYATDFMAIGNRWTVRGYDGEYTLAGERGWTLRNDLEFAHWGQATFYVGFDGGQVGGSQTLSGRTLTGWGTGVRGHSGRAFFDLFAGAPLSRPSSFPGGAVGYFQVGYQL